MAAALGRHGNPEQLAYGASGLPRQPLYRLVFLQREVWGARYNGRANDTVCLDIYDHWLEAC